MAGSGGERSGSCAAVNRLTTAIGPPSAQTLLRPRTLLKIESGFAPENLSSAHAFFILGIIVAVLSLTVLTLRFQKSSASVPEVDAMPALMTAD